MTGDELVDVWDTPGRGRIRNSNGYAVLAQARWAGAEVRSLGVVPDQAERIAEAVREGFASDVLVISGGVSEGAFDLVEEVLARFDVGLLFTKVAIKPGAPLVFGRRGDKPRLRPARQPGLGPGHVRRVRPPGAAAHAGRARGGAGPRCEVELEEAVRNRSGRKAYPPARVRFEGGRLRGAPVRPQGSADVVAHARANALRRPGRRAARGRRRASARRRAAAGQLPRAGRRRLNAPARRTRARRAVPPRRARAPRAWWTSPPSR